jgi:hypothetical protein
MLIFVKNTDIKKAQLDPMLTYLFPWEVYSNIITSPPSSKSDFKQLYYKAVNALVFRVGGVILAKSRCHDPQELWEITAVTHMRCLSNTRGPHFLQKSLGWLREILITKKFIFSKTNKPKKNIDIYFEG